MSKTITIREAFERNIREAEEDLAEWRERLQLLEDHAPEILSAKTELAWDSYPVWGEGYFIDIHDHELRHPGLAIALLNKTRHSEVRANTDRKLEFFIHLDGDSDSEHTMFHVNLIRLEKEPCKRARVTETKEIEVCDSLDESKYDKVEWLEPA